MHALSLPPRAGERSCQPRDSLHPPKSASTLHEWPMLLHVSVAMGNVAIRGQDGAADATWASPAAISRLMTNVSGHHLLKTLPANPHPRTAKLPIPIKAPPQGLLSGQVRGSGRVHVFAEEGENLWAVPQTHSPRAECVWAAGSWIWAAMHHVPPSLPSCASSPRSA